MTVCSRLTTLQTLGGKPHEIYQRLQNLAYRLTQGWGRGRHSSFNTSNTTREQWRVIGITSSELSIREFAQAAGRQRQGGECVRLIDVPILMNGEPNLFDRTKLPLVGQQALTLSGSSPRRFLKTTGLYSAGTCAILSNSVAD